MNKEAANLLHKEAMDLAEEAFLLEKKRDLKKSESLFKKAFEKERSAAISIPSEDQYEPSRSILFRSAASLAMRIKEYREAEKMIGMGLSGNPPKEIADELRDIYENITFERHLQLRGITLVKNEVQLSLSGNNVGHGTINTEEFLEKVETFKKLTLRTADRLKKLPFQDHRNKELIDFDMYISTPRAASFAVTIKLSKADKQMGLNFTSEIQVQIDEDKIIDEVIKGLEFLNDGKENDLDNLIEDEVYRRNFIALAKDFAPDGNKITQVGLTVIKNNQEKKVAIRRKKEDYKRISSSNKSKGEKVSNVVEIIGTLFYADARKNTLKLVDDKDKEYVVKVLEGLGDIVRPHWEKKVKVTGTLKNKTIKLQDISPL